MSKANHKEALVVYYPKAGRADDFGLDKALALIVRRLCEESSYVARVRSLQLGISAEDIASADLVVAVGGDGTIRRVLGAVADVGLTEETRDMQRPDVAIVPLGTGNLFARYLGLFGKSIADPVNHAVDIILNGDAVDVDLGKMNDQYFCIDAGVGPIANAIVAPKPYQKRRLKMFAYVAPLLQSMRRKPGVFRIEADGEEFILAASGIFITNADEMGIGTLGYGQITDGQLDLCILHPKTIGDYWNIVSRFGSWFIGGVASGEPPYTVRKVRKVTIETRSMPRPPSWWHRMHTRFERVFIGREPAPADKKFEMITMLDGDRCGFTPMHVQIVPAAVRIKVPPKSTAEKAAENLETAAPVTHAS